MGFLQGFFLPAGEPGPESDQDTEYSDDEPCQIISEHCMRSPTPVPPPTDHAMDIVEESSASYSRDVLEMLRLSYGYSSPLVDIVGSVDHKWEKILLALGFVEDLQELSISESEKHPIGVFFISDCWEDRSLHSDNLPSPI